MEGVKEEGDEEDKVEEIIRHKSGKRRTTSSIEHQTLQDLVYVKYNQAFHERYECHDLIDPIALNEIDDSNEWIVGELDGEGEDAEEMLLVTLV
ncbi:hypothetical protein CR513_59680, partial [Mucuna pruriens]